MKILYKYIYISPIGNYEIQFHEHALCRMDVSFSNKNDTSIKEDLPIQAKELLEKIIQQLDEYFTGKRTDFTLPLDASGTTFQKKVWDALSEIPYGETRTYKEIAVAVGNEKACRAVGMANHNNPISIIVPCHRVIGSNGSLTGYGGGLEKKQALLELEAKILAHN